MSITWRSPRPGESFRVNPNGRSQATILLDAPENGVVSEPGFHLVADEIAPKLWTDSKIAPHLRRMVFYMCCNTNGENFIWPVDETDTDSLAAAHVAETQWVEAPDW
jgi:hypothetical protein